MRLGEDPEIGKFRAEFGAFLDAHVPGWARAWQRTLFDAGWLLPASPAAVLRP